VNKKVEDTIVDQNLITEKVEKLTCGIIMPIAGMGAEYPADHWADVMKIIHTAVERAGFIPRIVSDSEESTVIHGSIINNIYNDAIVVCDVSNKNANVMFELGMRLAFNKPVVIIKDDKTDYSFDTGNIQHENYRRDLRHSTVEKFINDLSKKIKKTHEASLKSDYQSFLSYFGKFEVARIENKPIGESEAIEKLLNKMGSIELRINNLNLRDENSSGIKKFDASHSLVLTYDSYVKNYVEEIQECFENYGISIKSVSYDKDSQYLLAIFENPLNLQERIRFTEIIENYLQENALPF